MLQRQARALGDPTRHDIFRYIADANDTVGVAELTDRFGFHHNAIRQHLTKLIDAELIVESTAAVSGRGRPRLEYRIDPTAESRWDVTGPYERLSLLLSEIVRTGDSPVEVGRRAARRRHLGESPSDSRTDDPAAILVADMARAGFAPALRHREGDRVDIVLDNCPFVTTALADPDTVCAIHLGLAEGTAERVGGLVIDELIPRDPRQAKCLLRCHVTETPKTDDDAPEMPSDPAS